MLRKCSDVMLAARCNEQMGMLDLAHKRTRQTPVYTDYQPSSSALREIVQQTEALTKPKLSSQENHPLLDSSLIIKLRNKVIASKKQVLEEPKLIKLTSQLNFQQEMSRHDKLTGSRKITRADISFESDDHNIYSPYFSS